MSANSMIGLISSRAGGYSVFLTPTAAVFSIQVSSQRAPTPGSDGVAALEQPTSRRAAVAIHMEVDGANPNAQAEGVERLPGVTNYFIGNDPAEWHAHVANYSRVAYEGVYSGIDLVYYSTSDGALEFDFIVAPGADPSQIRLNFAGADDLEISEGGKLEVHAAGATLVQDRPYLYQEVNGQRRAVGGAFALDTDSYNQDVTFKIDAYDPDLPLVIDPVVLGPVYSTFLGGSFGDVGNSIAVDQGGAVYVTGMTDSTNFPTTPGAFDESYNWGTFGTDCYVAKLNSDGGSLLYSTYLGGGGTVYEECFAIGVDGNGSAFVTGRTLSESFPTTLGAFDTAYHNGGDAFVTKLSADGSQLLYSTYLGGSLNDTGWGLAVDGAGSAYVSGSTASGDFPTTAGAWDTDAFGYDCFVTKLNAGGSGLHYSTFLGGSGTDTCEAVALDKQGNTYLTGSTTSGFFPTTVGAYDTSFNDALFADPFVTKLNASGTGLVYSTFVGVGSAAGIAIDATGSAYITGFTDSNGFPTTLGAFDASYNGGGDAFVSKLNAAGSALVYSTYLGGSTPVGEDRGLSITVSGNNAYVTGATFSSNFPTTPNAFDQSWNGQFDAFVTQLSGSGSALVYSSFIGGSSYDNWARADIEARNGNVFLTGSTLSNNFPTTAGAYDTTHNGSGYDDAFVTKFRLLPQATAQARPLP